MRIGIPGRAVSVFLVALTLFTLVSFGQPAKPNVPTGMEEQAMSMSLVQFLQRGGAIIYLLGALSILGVALILYLFVVLRAEQVVPRAFRKDVLSKIGDGNFNEVRTACSYRPCPLGEITLVAVDFIEANPSADATLLKDIIEGEGSRQAVSIQGQTQYLLDVAVISPMVGLLGTVFGMVHAFNVVAFDLAKAKPVLLAAGVGEALVNTAAGLIVGIPAMMFYAYFRGRSSKLVSVLESASTEILTALLRKSPR
jgi:biopolymer transport protein ExbB